MHVCRGHPATLIAHICLSATRLKPLVRCQTKLGHNVESITLYHSTAEWDCNCCAGAYTAGLMTEKEMHDVVRNACPGAGACGGMYTANTMSSAIEAMGMSLPYSSSVPAVDPMKKAECRRAGK